jgi:TonB-linked SusC/RagA family outer membrane protein
MKLFHIGPWERSALAPRSTAKLLKVMRLTAVLLTIFSLHVAGHTTAQINYQGKEVAIQKVLEVVKVQGGIFMAYNEVDLKLELAKPVTVSLKNSSVKEALDEIFKNQPLTYSIVNKTVFVIKKASDKTTLFELSDPPINVRGKIVNEDGEPLAGVTIQVKGTSKASATNSNGEFELLKVQPDGILLLTAVNMEPISEKVNGRKEINFKLKVKLGILDQVQVIAYGTTSQRVSTGNVNTIKAKDIEKQPVNNPLLTLQGRVPGVIVTQSSGVPGGAVTIRIQGRNNLNTAFTNSDPLIVIDGVPYPSQNLGTFNGGIGIPPILGNSANPANASAQQSFGNPLNYINPSDIESITILRDADATSIYGSRAANGAVLITTKKGKSGELKADFSIQQGWGNVAHKLDLLNSSEYMEMRREAKKNDNTAIGNSDYDLRGLWDTTRYTDWQEELLGKTAKFTKLSAGISGGTPILNYLLAANYGRETTVFPGDFDNRKASFHFNIGVTSVNQRFKAQLTATYMVDQNQLPGEDFTGRALTLPPVAPALYNADGSLNWAPDPKVNNNSSWLNPLSNLYNQFHTTVNNLVSNLDLSYRILPGLDIKGIFGYNNISSDQFIASLNNSVKPELRANRIRSAVFTNGNSKSWIFEPQVSYEKRIGFNKFNLLVGSSFQQATNEGRAFTARGQASDQLLEDIQAAASLSAAYPDISEYKYSAIFARINYNYNDKYIINLTGRRDGSSRFGPQNMFNNFGAVGLAWLFSNEQILKGNKILSFGKFRASWGMTGNDQIGNYQYMSLFNSVGPGIPYQSVLGVQPSRLSNEYLEWEETKKLQLGIDLGFFNDRILLTLTYVNNKSSNTLLTDQLPATTGYQSVVNNIPAVIQNKALEASISGDILRSKNVTWNTSLNLTIPSNKLLAYPNLESSVDQNFFVIGKSVSIIRSFKFYGVDPNTGKYLVVNKNGIPTSTPDNALDLLSNLNPDPKLYGGLNNSISYHGLQLDFLVQFTIQNGFHVLDFYTPPGRMSVSSSTPAGNQTKNVLNRWRKVGDNTIYHRYTASSATFYSSNPGDRNFLNSSFARLKNVSISYQFPKSILEKIHMRALKIFSNAQNLLTLTKYEGLDPETMSVENLPPLRMITVGLQATL